MPSDLHRGVEDDGPIGFRPLVRTDFTLLTRWFVAPHVAPWWQEPSGAAAIEDH